jgi:hypothetical protein
VIDLVSIANKAVEAVCNEEYIISCKILSNSEVLLKNSFK